MNYVIMTDSDSDLPFDLKVKYDIPVVYMPYVLNGKEYFDDLGQTINHKAYYDSMREGAVPTTSALNEETYLEYFEPILKEQDLLFIAFSSKLSRTLESAYAVQKQLMEKYPERKFIIVDTLAISAPQTILVIKACQMAQEGRTIEEVAAWLEANKLRSQAYFTVDDLKYLQRGGRVSAMAAAVGGMLDLKPVIMESREGTLVSIAKIHGRRKAIAFLVEKAVENMADPKEATAIILHADDPEDAETLRKSISEKLPDLAVRIDNVGPVIGAHCGPGTLAICFLGKERPQ